MNALNLGEANKTNAIVIAVFVLCVFVIVMTTTNIGIVNEQFATRKDKARAIVDWFSSNPKPTYSKYKKDMDKRSNIVEYEDAMALFTDKNLTLSSVEQSLSK